MYKCRNNKGFTLLEMSIVLIIVALIIFGIMGGNTLVGISKRAKARMYTGFAPVLSIDDIELWLESVDKDSIVKSINKVAQWNDKGPKLNLAIQDTDSERPEVIDSGIGEVTSISFSGTGDNLKITQLKNMLLDDFTIILAIKTPDIVGTSAEYIIDGADSSNRLMFAYMDTTKMFYIGTPTSDLYSTSTYATSRIFVVSIVIEDGSTASLYVNGVLDVSGSISNASLNGVTIGSLYNSAADFNGEISEVIMYSRNLEDDERIDIEEYLKKKYEVKS